MSARMWLGALAVGAVTLGAPARTAAFGSQAPDARPAADAAHRPFTPPADGRLTSDEIKTYIAVRRLAATLVPPDDKGSDPAAQIARLVARLSSEGNAVSQLGADIDEYRWTSARVAEAEGGAQGHALLDAIAAAASAGRGAIGPAGSESGKPAAESQGTSAASLAYNRQLLNRFRTDLDALKTR